MNDPTHYPRVRWHSEHGPVLETCPGAYTLLTVGLAYQLMDQIARCFRIGASGHMRWPNLHD
jgi:hypothetical protein